MSYLEEWNRQQKAMKDSDREKKRGATKNLQDYRGTEQLQFARQQRAQKEADRQLRELASASLKNYRGGGHDVKEYQRIATKYRERQLQKIKEQALLHGQTGNSESEDSLSDESWRQLVDKNIKEYEELIKEEMAKAAAECHIEKQEDEQEENQPTVADYKAHEHKENESSRGNLTFWSLEDSPKSQMSYEKRGNSSRKIRRRLIELDFSFGLILDANTPAPSMDSCAHAAAKIVPVSLSKSLAKTKAIFDPRFTAVVNSVGIDPAFDSASLIRYIVKGKVPIYVSTKKGSKTSSNQENDTSDSQMLSQRSELIIGREDEKQWRRVREGARPSWDTILMDSVR